MGYDVSTYAVRGTLIDTAFSHVAGEIGAWLDARRPDGVIVTHYHEDHAGNVEVAAHRGYPLWIARETLDHLRRPAPIHWYRRWCWGAQRPLASAVVPFVHAELQVIHTPGHSSDHHVVWDAARETVFGADLFLGVHVRVTHPWPREDVRAQVPALRRVIALQPKRYFDAHRGLVPDAVAQLSAKLQWMEDTIAEVDALLAEGLDDAAIVRRVFGGEEWWSYLTWMDYSRRNFVGGLRASTTAKTP